MGKAKQGLGAILLWTFERGQVAYDILVVIILLFIFITPRSCFERRKPAADKLKNTPAVTSTIPQGPK